MEDLELPAFLDRKINGIEPRPFRYHPGRRRRRAKSGPDCLRVYLANPGRGLACGWNTVHVLSVGRKHVRVKGIGKTRAVQFDRAIWDRLAKEEIGQ